MSLFDRYMLQPATTCTEEALWAQYMNVLLMGMSFSGLSTLFTSVRAIPKSGPVQVSAILWILVCAILPFLQVLHIPWYVQYCLFSSIAHTTVCAILPFPKYPKVSRYPCVARLGTCLSFPRVVCSTTIDLQVLVFGVRANMLAAAPLDPRLYFQFESHKRSNCTPTAAHSTLRVSSCCSSISPRRLGIDVLPLSWYRRSASV